jgi:hypothetical protein
LIIKTEACPSKPLYYSVSRLKTYSQCSEYYRRQYVELDVIRSMSSSTLLGSLVHNALESYYKGLSISVDRAFEDTAFPTLVSLGVCTEEESKVLETYLNDYAAELSSLFRRASALYTGSDAIRTKTGEVPSNPFMTSTWKKAVEEKGLEGTKSLIDTYISDRAEGIEFSVSDVFAEAKAMCKAYTYPEMGSSIGIEMGLSVWDKSKELITNPVLMPSGCGREEGLYLNGYIDMVTNTGDGNILICDHKTGKEDFTESAITHNAQLLSYVYAYRELTGTKAKYIGINNVRLSKLTIVPTPSDDVIEDILLTLFSNHKGISSCFFNKKRPEAYSPCLAMYGKTCPYLSKCWPLAVV